MNHLKSIAPPFYGRVFLSPHNGCTIQPPESPGCRVENRTYLLQLVYSGCGTRSCGSLFATDTNNRLVLRQIQQHGWVLSVD
jgi:hypothetical protein